MRLRANKRETGQAFWKCLTSTRNFSF